VPSTEIKMEAFGTVKRDPTSKGVPLARTAGRAFFHASDTIVLVPAGATILDAADTAGIFIDNACRSGTCGSCRVRLVLGRVQMEVEDALTAEDKAAGYILACQAEPLGDVTVEA
jgi:ferredoxin